MSFRPDLYLRQGTFWVPPQVAAEVNARMRRVNAVMRLGWSELTGGRMAFARVVELARHQSADTLMAAASYLSVVSRGSHDVGFTEAQAQAAALMFDPQDAAVVAGHLHAGTRSVWISDDQLLMLARIAVVHSPDGPVRQAGWRGVGDILLGINDFLSLRETDAAQRGELTGVIARAQSLGARETTAHAVGRYHEMLFQGDASTGLREPFAAIFRESRGHDLEDHLFLASVFRTCARHLGEKSNGHGLIPGYARELVQSLEPSSLRDEVLPRVAATRGEFSAAFGHSATEEDLRSGGHGAFLDRFLYRTHEGDVLPVNLRLVEAIEESGVFWLLRRAFERKLGRDPGRSVFGGEVGRLFEAYASALMTRVYSTRAPTRFLAESDLPARQGPLGDLDPPDGVLHEDQRVVVFECWSAPVHLETMLGNATRLTQDIAGPLMEKVGQLDASVRAILAGELVIPGVDLVATIAVHPVLVLLHPWPQYPQVWDVIRAEMKARGLMDNLPSGPPVLPLQILTADDLEAFEGLAMAGGPGLSHWLVRKLTVPFDEESSLRGFLDRNGISIPDNGHVQRACRSYVDMLCKGRSCAGEALDLGVGVG